MKSTTQSTSSSSSSNDVMEATDTAPTVQYSVLLHSPEMRALVFSFLDRTLQSLSTLDATCKIFRKATQPLWEKLTMEKYYEAGVAPSHIKRPFALLTEFSRCLYEQENYDFQRKLETLDLSLTDLKKNEKPAGCKVLACPKRMGSTRVVWKNPSAEDFEDYIAIPDTLDPKRIFIGQVKCHALLGGICYFDDDGELECPIRPFFQVVFKMGDGARFTTEAENLILCGENLLYAKTPYGNITYGTAVLLEGVVLEDDKLGESSENSVFVWLKIQAPGGYQVYDWCRKILFGRWLCLDGSYEVVRKQIIYVDLLSFRNTLHENQKDFIAAYDRVVLPADINPTAALQSIQESLPSYKHSPMRKGLPR